MNDNQNSPKNQRVNFGILSLNAHINLFIYSLLSQIWTLYVQRCGKYSTKTKNIERLSYDNCKNLQIVVWLWGIVTTARWCLRGVKKTMGWNRKKSALTKLSIPHQENSKTDNLKYYLGKGKGTVSVWMSLAIANIYFENKRKQERKTQRRGEREWYKSKKKTMFHFSKGMDPTNFLKNSASKE